MRNSIGKMFIVFLIGLMVACAAPDVSSSPGEEPEAQVANETAELTGPFTLEIKMEGLIGFVREGGTPANPDKLHALFVNASGDGPADTTYPPVSRKCCQNEPICTQNKGGHECDLPNHRAIVKVPLEHIGVSESGYAIFPLRSKKTAKRLELTLEGLNEQGKECTNLSGGRELEISGFDLVPKLRDYRYPVTSSLGKTRRDLLNNSTLLSARGLFELGTVTTSPNQLIPKPPAPPTPVDIYFRFECPKEDPACSWKDDSSKLADQASLAIQCPSTARPVLKMVAMPGNSVVREIPLIPNGGKVAVELLNLLPDDIVGRYRNREKEIHAHHFRWLYNLSVPRVGGQDREDYVSPYCDPASCPSGGWPVCAFAELEPGEGW